MVDQASFCSALSDALELDIAAVSAKAEGLAKARRLDAVVTPSGAADLLAALLCTQPGNATAAADLPFVGAIHETNGGPELIAPEHPAYGLLDAPLSGFLAALIQSVKHGQRAPRSIDRIDVMGHGESLRACVEIDAPLTLAPGRLSCWFGYRLLPELLSLGPANPTALRRTHSVNGQILDTLAELFSQQDRGTA